MLRAIMRPYCLVVLPSFRTGGAEKVLVRVVNAMAEAGLSMAIVAISGEGELRDFVNPGITVHDLGVARTRHALPRLIRLIRRVRPAVVFTTLSRTNLLVLAARRWLPAGTRIIIREANVPTSDLVSFGSFWAAVYRTLYRLLYPKADRVICQSRAMAEDLIVNFGVSPERVVLINNPAPAVDPDACRRAASPFGPGLNYLAVGRLDEQKGYDTLLAAFALVLRQRPDARLTILGRGPLEQSLAALASQLGLTDRVAFRGFEPEPLPYYAHADALVLASRWEGFPNVLVEALACGTPVVATDAPGGSAEIVVPGENGLLVPVDRSDALAEAMLQVLQISARHDRAAISRTIARFHPDDIFRRYRDVLLTVARQRSEE